MVGLLLSLWGCVGMGVPPEEQESSAIGYAQRVSDKVYKIADQGTYKVLSGKSSNADYRFQRGDRVGHIYKNIPEQFRRFCTQRLQGTIGSMPGSATVCTKGHDQVLFFVHYHSAPVPPPPGSKQIGQPVDYDVYEPVGAPSEAFFAAIRPHGYLTEPERKAAQEADTRAQKLRADEAYAREQRELHATLQREAQEAEQCLRGTSRASERSRCAEVLNQRGVRYVNGDRVARDPAQAKVYFEKAISLGSEEARNNLYALDGSVATGSGTAGSAPSSGKDNKNSLQKAFDQR